MERLSPALAKAINDRAKEIYLLHGAWGYSFVKALEEATVQPGDEKEEEVDCPECGAIFTVPR